MFGNGIVALWVRSIIVRRVGYEIKTTMWSYEIKFNKFEEEFQGVRVGFLLCRIVVQTTIITLNIADLIKTP